MRINHDTVREDLEGAVWPGLKRIRYPKTESAEELRAIDEIVTRLQIETAVGVVNVFEIAGATPRVKEFGASSGGYDPSRPGQTRFRRGKTRMGTDTKKIESAFICVYLRLISDFMGARE